MEDAEQEAELKKMSLAHFGKPLPEEQKQKMSKSYLNRCKQYSVEQKKNMIKVAIEQNRLNHLNGIGVISVNQINIVTNEIIKIWHSIIEASKALHINQSNIT